jgi:hypothetical protein
MARIRYPIGGLLHAPKRADLGYPSMEGLAQKGGGAMIVSVGKSRELTKIRQQLASGQSAAALRRLQTLATVDPTDREVHHLLVQIHRQRGDAASAGRWGFLSNEATEDEIRAFECQHPSPWVRLRLLRWVGDPGSVPNPAGRARLEALTALAERTGAAPPAVPDAPRNSVFDFEGFGTGGLGSGEFGSGAYPHIPASRSPSGLEYWSAPAAPAVDEPATDQADPATSVPFSRRQLRKARRRAERLRRRELRREVRASTLISLLMITILIVLGVLGSLGAVRTMRTIIEHLTSALIS